LLNVALNHCVLLWTTYIFFFLAKVDGWKPGTEVCTIPFTTKCDATGKKQALLNAWANTVAGELQTKAKTSGTVQTAKIKEKFAALPAAEISANVIFQQVCFFLL